MYWEGEVNDFSNGVGGEEGGGVNTLCKLC